MDYKVLKAFNDKQMQTLHKPNAIIDITAKRAKEIIETLGDSYIEKVKEK